MSTDDHKDHKRDRSDELMEQFGWLPSDESDLSDDERQLLADLTTLQKRLGDDESFYPDDATVDRLAEGVDRRIHARTSESSLGRSWQRYATYLAPLAAALVLLLGIGSLWRWSPQQPAESVEYVYVYSVDESAVQPDSQMVETLLLDYAFGAGGEPAEWLLDDLTDEEMQYLEKSFDMGELL